MANIAWIYCDFRPYALHQGLEIMREDMNFIEKIVSKIPITYQRKALKAYVQIWMQELETHKDNAIGKQNLGRRAANSYLREQVE